MFQIIKCCLYRLRTLMSDRRKYFLDHTIRMQTIGPLYTLIWWQRHFFTLTLWALLMSKVLPKISHIIGLNGLFCTTTLCPSRQFRKHLELLRHSMQYKETVVIVEYSPCVYVMSIIPTKLLITSNLDTNTVCIFLSVREEITARCGFSCARNSWLRRGHNCGRTAWCKSKFEGVMCQMWG